MSGRITPPANGATVDPDDFAPRGDFDQKRRTSGVLTLNTVVWDDLDNGLDITLAAASGDWVEVGVNARWENNASWGLLDVVSVVSAAPVNSWATDGAPDDASLGVPAWVGETGQFESVGGSVFRQLVSGDVSGGNVVLRLRKRTLAAVAKELDATGPSPFIWWAKNHGSQP